MIEPIVIAFSGSRTFDDRQLVERIFRRLAAFPKPKRTRVGDARGFDELVTAESTRWGSWPEVEACHWPPAGATRAERWAAAHERNIRVVLGSPEHPGRAERLVAAFAPGPRSPGTSDAIAIALDAGIRVDVYHEGRWSSS